MNDDQALPAHYRKARPAKEDELRPTPGIEATECADPETRRDLNAVHEHKRRRSKSSKR